MKKKFIAKCSFINSGVGGSIKEGQEVPDSPAARYLEKNGYLEEYKTKVVNRKPAKPKKKTTKKTAKK